MMKKLGLCMLLKKFVKRLKEQKNRGLKSHLG